MEENADEVKELEEEKKEMGNVIQFPNKKLDS